MEINDDGKIEIKSYEKEIGLKWYYFYITFSLPLGGIVGLVEAKGVFDKGYNIIAVMLIILSILQFIVAFGLSKRKLWAFYFNIALIAIAIITVWKPNQGFPEFLGALTGIALLWYLPNYLYWKKRKYLFK